MKQWFVRWLVVLAMLPGFAMAQTLPVSAMQKAVAGVIEKKMVARGFASNDPRWAATLQSGSSTIAGAALAAAAVTAAGITAPAWVTAAGTAALGALLAYGIDLAVDGVKWLINGDGSVTYTPASGGAAPPPDSGGAMTAGGSFYNAGSIYGGSGANVAKEHTTLTRPGMTFVGGHTDASGTYWYWVDDPNSAEGHCAPYAHCQSLAITPQSSGAPANCGGGMIYDGSCRALTPTGSGGTPAPVTKSATEAVSALSAADKAKPANPALVAKIADAIWQKAAAQPGYAGVPYDAANPITASDAAAYQTANPQSWPTVGDVTSPQAPASGQSAGQPFALPNSAADPVTAPSTGNQTPPISEPPLDWAIPAYADQIGRQSVGVSYVPTVFAAPTGCPAPVTFHMFGKPYSIGYGPFCDLMATLAPLFLACGAAAAALIFAESLKS